MIPRKSFKFLILFLRMNCEGNIFKCVRRFYVKFHFKLMKITISKVFKPFKKSKYFMRFVRTRWTLCWLNYVLIKPKISKFHYNISSPQLWAILKLSTIYDAFTLHAQSKGNQSHRAFTNSLKTQSMRIHHNIIEMPRQQKNSCVVLRVFLVECLLLKF